MCWLGDPRLANALHRIEISRNMVTFPYAQIFLSGSRATKKEASWPPGSTQWGFRAVDLLVEIPAPPWNTMLFI